MKLKSTTPRWQDLDFSIELADPEFMRLIDDEVDASMGEGIYEDCERALLEYGAWVETIDGRDFWRHPSRKAAQP